MALFRFLLIAVILPLTTVGCQSTASMYAWTPARMKSTVGDRVALAQIVGPTNKTSSFLQALLESQPQDTARQVQIIEQHQLQTTTSVQLAAAIENVPSDMAILHAAKQQGIDYVWIGEIMQPRATNITTQQQPLAATPSLVPYPAPTSTPLDSNAQLKRATREARPQFTVSWQLIDVARSQQAGGQPVTVTHDSLRTNHPDLWRQLEQGDESVWAKAAARDSWQLLTPHLHSIPVRLANPYGSLRAGKIREGNRLAQQSHWDQAEKIWSQVAERDPRNHAALHNLALAAAAREDFASAKTMAQNALRLHSSAHYEQTVVWIEQRQIEFTEAFQLPPPDQGWLFSPDSRATTLDFQNSAGTIGR
jgi:tetratricopeptide (TPR) repeat protein